MRLKVSELQLGDVIMIAPNHPWMTGIVNKIEDRLVHVFRPYGTCADFSMGSQVITYIGMENVTFHVDDVAPLEVYERKAIR